MSKTAIFALIDCNNFFVSCERLFRPDLEGKPIVVLSSGDGCVVARSNEAKKLGIPMGAPVFKHRDILERHNVIKFSANFEMYGNISRRITALLTSVTPRIEIYSVDESFLDLSELAISDYEAWGKQVRQLIWDYVGIPVSIGIAPNKTLAKLASALSKQDPDLQGVLSFVKSHEKSDFSQFNRDKTRSYLLKTPVHELWGIVRRLAPKMRAEGVGTGLDVANLQPRRAQQLMGIHGRQMVAELNGMSCYPLELEGKLPQSISVTRTFGEDTSDPAVIEAALATFTNSGAFKLRRSNQLTRKASIFMTSNKHKPGYATWHQEVVFNQPTADTGVLITALSQAFHQIYNKGASYHRAGMLLQDFVPDHQLQTDMLGTINVIGHAASIDRMLAIDTINNKFGKGKIRFAAEDLAKIWQPKHQLRSPRYVSNWDELPRLKIHTTSGP